MNKTILVFTLVMALLSPIYALDWIDTTVTGTNGLPGEDAIFVFGFAGPHTISGSTVTGGSALSVTDAADTDDAFGGAGARFGLGLPFITNKEVNVDSSTLQGGQGGNISIEGSLSTDANAYGGIGFLTTGGRLTFTDSSVYGGDGGGVAADGGEVNVDVTGGSAITITDGFIVMDNGYAEGGRGGSANTSGAAASSANGGNGLSLINSTFTNSIVGSELIGGNGGTANNQNWPATADGGDGLSVSNLTGSLVISNSVLTGGNGGAAAGTNSTAQSGAGLRLIDAADVQIIDTTLTGGSGGASIDIQGSTVNLVGGELVDELLFSGTSTSAISLQGTTMGAARQTGGIVNVDDWDAAHFQNTTIADGTMNFNGQMFNLAGTFELQTATAAANFNNGLTVQDGGTMNLGVATATAPSVLTEDGSRINTTYNGTTLGQITSTGALTINSGTTWAIAAGTNAVAVDQTFDLATAAGTITTNITADDVIFNGSGGAAGWLGGISDLQVVGPVLQATYGENDIDEALGVAGNTSTEFGKAMTDLSRLVQPGSIGYDLIGTLAGSQAEGTALLANSYVRTTEMANTLVGLQSIFSDQIRDRTRSHLRQEEVGYPAASTPAGSGGWEAMRTFSDRMENSFGAEQVKNMVDAVTPDVDIDVMEKINAAAPDVKIEKVTLPPTYKTWGRAYGSYIDQNETDGSPGYEVNIGGGMLGIDKQINNILIGVAGGYANAQVDGDTSKDGSSDTGHASVYFSAHGDRLFLDANATYAFNHVETEYDILDSEGDYDAQTVGLYLGGGYVITIAKRILLTPEVSILSTYYTRDDYTETLALLPDLKWDSYDEWSYLGTVGATLSMIHKIDLRDAEIAVQPEVRAHWLHEFNDEFDDEEYKMVGGQYTVAASLLARDEDLVKVGAGVRLSKWASDTTEIGLDVDGVFGDDYDAYIVSGKIMYRF